MTPTERAVSGQRRWFLRLINDVDILANELKFTIDAPPEAFSITSRNEELDRIFRKLRKRTRECAHHGLGITVQQLLPIIPKEE